MSYSTITFTRGDKDLIPTFITISMQDYKPKESILVIDSRWIHGNYTLYHQISLIENILVPLNIKFSVYISGKLHNNFAKVKNFGYSKVETSHVLYVEDDCLIPANYANNLFCLMIRNYYYGSSGGIQLLIEDSDDIQEKPIFDKIELPEEKYYQRLKVENGKLEYDSIKHQCYLYKHSSSEKGRTIPCHALLHTYMLNMEVLREVGMWDENAPEHGSLIFEEMDVMFRMHLKGYINWIHTDLIMYHYRKSNRRTENDKISQREALREERKLYFGQKYIREGLING